jgi:hypothetical protein
MKLFVYTLLVFYSLIDLLFEISILQKTNPVVAEIFSLMSRDQGWHAG